MMLSPRPESARLAPLSLADRRRSRRSSPWRPLVEALEDRLVPAPVIEVFLANGPNPVGLTPGFTGNPPSTPPGFGTRATTALQASAQGVVPPANVSNPPSPSDFVAGPTQTRVTFQDLIASSFPSWKAMANPGTTFSPAFANEQGNFEYYLVRVHESTPGVNTFRLADLAVQLTGSNPTATAFVSAANPGPGWQGDLNTTNTIGFDANGNQVSGPGTANTFIHDLFFTGIAFGDDATSFPGTDQQRLDAAVAELMGLQDAPGAGFSVTATYTLPFLGGGTATGAATVRISTPQADLGVTKTDNPDPVPAGGNLTYTVTVNNIPSANATGNATGTTLIDTLPAGVTLVSATPSQGTVSTSGNTITANLGTINNGANATLTIIVRAPNAPGTITNTATATANETDPNPANNTASQTTTVIVGVDLAVTKLDNPDPVLAGQTLTYTVNVSNAGPNNATGVALTDTLPAGTTFVSATPSQGTASFANGTVTANLGGIANGASATVTISVRAPTTPGVITNSATATANEADGNPGNNTGTATTTVNAAVDLAVTKIDSPDPVLAGQNLTYTVTVTNAGPDSATGVTLTDALPAGTTFVSATASQGTATNAGGTVTANLGTLANGANATVTIVARAPATPGSISNSATATATETDLNPNNNTGTATTTVNAAVDLAVSKTDSPDPVGTGQNITYTVTVNNAGPDSATGVTLTDTLPAGTTFVSATASQGTATNAGGTVTANLGTLANGANATVTIVAQAPSAGGTVTNTASVTSTEADTNPANNTGTATTTVSAVVDLAVSKSGSPLSVAAGQRLTYTVTVANLGPGGATGVALTDTLPAGTTFVSASSTQGTVTGLGGSVTGSLGTIAAGASATVTIVVQAPSTTATLTNTATATANETDSNPANNTATATNTVTALVNLAVRKAAATSSVTAGQTATFFVVVANFGPSTATGVVVTDTDSTGRTFSMNLGTLAPGASSSFTLPLTTTAAGTLTNTASVTANQAEMNPADNTSTASVTVTAPTPIAGPLTDPNRRFVNQVFVDLLGRPASAAELDAFGNPLDQGTLTRAQVVFIVEGSPEYHTDVVEQLYQQVLGRVADAGGLAAFVNFLNQGGTIQQAEAIMLASDEFFALHGGTNTGFIQGVYLVVLNRAPSAAEVQQWLQVLAGGASRLQVATDILTSPEGQTDLVQRLYQRFLGRPADASGLNYYVGALLNGATQEQVTASILASPEFFTDVNAVIHQLWVSQVYLDELKRPVDPAGLAFWTGLLNSTVATPFQVALAIDSSAEAETVYVQQLYVTYLNRPADPTGLTAAVNFLTSGGTREQLAAMLASSDEFFALHGGTNAGFLNGLYLDALGRPIDQPTLALDSQALASGAASRAQIAASVLSSPEYRTDLVGQLYLQLLGRQPDASGLAAWVNLLNSGARDEQVIAGILSSPEFFSKL